MSDMIFVSLAHTLSQYIFSLDDRCKNMTDKERVLAKERLDPGASGGMNGYISLCAGDPCPPVYRSPISGMEDIMNNQVICAIYRHPDTHKHITRPPPGVIFPQKTVTMGDIKAAPVLWHEDSGRKPFDNGRHYNTNGALSGRQLADAAHRLVVNSLQVRGGQNGNPGQMYPPHPAAVGYGPHHQPYQNYTYTGGEPVMMQASSGYSHHRPSSSRQHYAPESHNNPYNRSQNPRNESNDRSVHHARGYSRHGYYAQVPPQHGTLHIVLGVGFKLQLIQMFIFINHVDITII